MVGSAVSAQRAVFSQLPVPIVFPRSLVGYVVSSGGGGGSGGDDDDDDDVVSSAQ